MGTENTGILIGTVPANALDVIVELRKALDASQEEVERAQRARKFTQEWYARHYGKLEDWARKRLPEDWRHEFFNCVANGSWGHKDLGETYTAVAGFTVTPTNYFHVDTAEGQLIMDQTRRAEDAESELSAEREINRELKEKLAAWNEPLVKRLEGK